MKELQRRQRGFTLIEIIIVVILLAVLSIYSFSFLGIGSEMVAQVGARTQLAAEQRFAIERLNRELRASVPRSARANAACIEYMPMLGSNVYLSLPRPGPSGSNESVIVTPYLTSLNLVGTYFLVYATDPSYIYGNNQTRRKVISSVDYDTPQDGLATLSVSGTPATFFTDSPSRTFFIGAAPVSWCIDPVANQLLRFSGYTMSGTQPSLASLRSSATSQQLMAVGLENDIAGGQQPFRVLDPTLQRNNLIRLFFAFASTEAADATIDVTHEVFIPNVP